MSDKKPQIKTTPGILKWARETLGYQLSEVATKHKITEDQLRHWELGEPIPITQLKKLATRYKRSMGVFFLPHIPGTQAFPTNFRTLDSVKQDKLDPTVRLAIRKARRNRRYFEELSELLEQPPENPKKKLILRHNSSIQEQAAKFRQLLNVDVQTQFKWKDKEDALKGWITALENFGFLIFQMPMPLEKKNGGIRGFCLRDQEDELPVIVLNTADWPAGRIFTLFHECAHLLLSKQDLNSIKSEFATEASRHKEIEKFGNAFAGSFLVPEKTFFNEANVGKYLENIEDDDALRALANKYRVSPQVILRRLYDAGKISRPFFERKNSQFDQEFKKYKERIKEKIKERAAEGKGGGPPPATVAFSSSGKKLTEKIFQAQESKKISFYDLVRFFEVKSVHIEKIKNRLHHPPTSG